jgi:hypothetical protein
MKPKLYEYSSKESVVGIVIDCISNFDCSTYFTTHIGKSQSEQKIIVGKFQEALCNALSESNPTIKWEVEYLPHNSRKDSIDIFGSNENINIVIELDKHRADQVAKKFVSRNSLLIDENIFYISLCYPGTSNMNSSECIKYFSYCKLLSERMGNDYAGFIIE